MNRESMRRSERQITAVEEITVLIDQCKVCRLALSENDIPYIVPLNFGYSFADGRLTLYFHGAREGKKIRIMRANPRACFEIDNGHRLIEAPAEDAACGYSFAYTSVIGFGMVEFITRTEEKISALNFLMRHQTGRDVPFTYREKDLAAVCVFKLNVSEFTGKQRG